MVLPSNVSRIKNSEKVEKKYGLFATDYVTLVHVRDKSFDSRVGSVVPVVRDGYDGIRFKHVKNRENGLKKRRARCRLSSSAIMFSAFLQTAP